MKPAMEVEAGKGSGGDTELLQLSLGGLAPDQDEESARGAEPGDIAAYARSGGRFLKVNRR
jgi:hypothetical protein